MTFEEAVMQKMAVEHGAAVMRAVHAETEVIGLRNQVQSLHEQIAKMTPPKELAQPEEVQAVVNEVDETPPMRLSTLAQPQGEAK